MPSSVTVIYYSELYRLILAILKLKCLKSGIAAATEYTSIACYRLSEAFKKRRRVATMALYLPTHIHR
ncbi:MAG: hypothetical protein ACTS73_09335 [Arsenophonus sp. NEOnobi-MAG3]